MVMKKEKNIEERITEYLNGELSLEESTNLIDELRKEGYSLEDIEREKILFNKINEIDIPETSSAMDEKFYDMLYSNPKSTKKKTLFLNELISNNKVFFRIAASIALFIIGWFGGALFNGNLRNDQQLINMQNEMSVMKKMVMLTMMEQPSSTERIKAVYMVNEITNVDSKIFAVLLKTLNSDENDNVRLVALEALKKYANYPEVREGLIQSISKQKSPLIQLALANIMVELQEKRSLPYFEQILQNKELNYSVRKKMDEVVNTLI